MTIPERDKTAAFAIAGTCQSAQRSDVPGLTPLADRSGRKINYLRLSVTDRCNMRCIYCMPADGIAKLGHAEILSYEQLLEIAAAAVSLGIEKIRVTGGEPLIRAGILDFLTQLAAISGLKQLVLTTNGVCLAEQAQALKNVGVQRLNVSLDSLQPEIFRQLTRRNLLHEVLSGIDAADRAGLSYKINMVVMRGRNDGEIIDFAELAAKRNCAVRFIEYMPILKDRNWRSLLVPGEEILQRLTTRFDLQPVAEGALSGPAQEFKISGTRGRIGVIAPLSGHFCRNCNRIRITAAGKVKTCLFSEHESDLKPVLQGGGREELAMELRRLVDTKPPRHQLSDCRADYPAFSMSQVGG